MFYNFVDVIIDKWMKLEKGFYMIAVHFASCILFLQLIATVSTPIRVQSISINVYNPSSGTQN